MLTANDRGNGSPSLSQRNESGGSPRDTPQTVRVRIPSAKPSWKEKGSIIGGTVRSVVAQYQKKMKFSKKKQIKKLTQNTMKIVYQKKSSSIQTQIYIYIKIYR
jgi:hypothetical protein